MDAVDHGTHSDPATRSGTRRDDRPTDADAVRRWAASGCMHLTGPGDGPGLGPPDGLVPGLDSIGRLIADRSGALGTRVDVDPLALLAARAAWTGSVRRGRTSCGRGARLVRCVDGWIAVSLVRPDDIVSIPAWLGDRVWARDPDVGSIPWDALEQAVASRDVASIVERATLLGLPVASVPTEGASRTHDVRPLFDGLVDAGGVDGAVTAGLDTPLVVDLGSLWAGPLCGALLASAGCRVVKVESTGRPDGARQGDLRFYDELNHAKRSVALDFTQPRDVDVLVRLLRRADVVIEASRPRALQRLGIDQRGLVAHGPRVWASITAHGATGVGVDRVGFGDDAAAAGGLVVRHDDHPYFCADAVADPVTGMVAAAAVLEALHRGGRWHLDLSMSTIASWFSGPTLDASFVAQVPTPEPPPLPPPTAAPLGADTSVVLDDLGLR